MISKVIYVGSIPAVLVVLRLINYAYNTIHFYYKDIIV